jgi:hypothetical protein
MQSVVINQRRYVPKQLLFQNENNLIACTVFCVRGNSTPPQFSPSPLFHP